MNLGGGGREGGGSSEDLELHKASLGCSLRVLVCPSVFVGLHNLFLWVPAACFGLS